MSLRQNLLEGVKGVGRRSDRRWQKKNELAVKMTDRNGTGTPSSHMPPASRIPVVTAAVMRLDSWLRHRLAIFEYSDREDCILRLQLMKADRPLALSDGTRIEAGDLIVNIHLWNEHLPPSAVAMASPGPARSATALRSRSASSIARSSGPSRSCAKRSRSLRMSGWARGTGAARSSGWPRATDSRASGKMPRATTGALRRSGENILMFLLVLATNPVAARLSVLGAAAAAYISPEARFAAAAGGLHRATEAGNDDRRPAVCGGTPCRRARRGRVHLPRRDERARPALRQAGGKPTATGRPAGHAARSPLRRRTGPRNAFGACATSDTPRPSRSSAACARRRIPPWRASRPPAPARDGGPSRRSSTDACTAAISRSPT